MDWFNAIRAARFHYLQVAFPGASDADVSFPACFFFLTHFYHLGKKEESLGVLRPSMCAVQLPLFWCKGLQTIFRQKVLQGKS